VGSHRGAERTGGDEVEVELSDVAGNIRRGCELQEEEMKQYE
jgi:hypothetical protein